MTAAELDALPLLDALDASARAQLLPCLESIEFPPRARLFREGDASDGVLWIVAGSVRAWSSRDAPVEIGRGGLFGAIALVTQGKRRFSADAVSQVRVLRLRRSAFQGLSRRAPQVACALLEALVADQAELFEEALDELTNLAQR